jgi:transaldolase
VKLLLDTAALDAIRWALDAKLADGVFVTPAALDADAFGIEPVAQLENISRIANATLIVTAGAVSADDLHRVGRDYAKVGDHVVVAVPFVEDGILALRRLATEGIRTAATFVVTPAQAILAAKAGAAYVCVSIDQLDAHGHDPAVVLRETRGLFDRHGVECDVVAIATGAARLATTAFVAGADTVVVSPATLRALLQHPLTDRSLDQLLSGLSRRPRPRPAR